MAIFPDPASFREAWYGALNDWKREGASPTLSALFDQFPGDAGKLLHPNGLTPLMSAAAANWAPAVKLLLAHGVDVKVKCGSYRKNWMRKTAKEIAQEEDAEECFKLLEAHERAAKAKKMAGIRKSARLAKR